MPIPTSMFEHKSIFLFRIFLSIFQHSTNSISLLLMTIKLEKRVTILCCEERRCFFLKHLFIDISYTNVSGRYVHIAQCTRRSMCACACACQTYLGYFMQYLFLKFKMQLQVMLVVCTLYIAQAHMINSMTLKM